MDERGVLRTEAKTVLGVLRRSGSLIPKNVSAATDVVHRRERQRFQPMAFCNVGVVIVVVSMVALGGRSAEARILDADFTLQWSGGCLTASTTSLANYLDYEFANPVSGLPAEFTDQPCNIDSDCGDYGVCESVWLFHRHPSAFRNVCSTRMCSFASQLFGVDCCEPDNFDTCRVDYFVEDVSMDEAIVEELGSLFGPLSFVTSGSFSAAATVESVVASIDEHRPVVATMSTPGLGLHAVLIIGYFYEGSTLHLAWHDPYGCSAYEGFCHAPFNSETTSFLSAFWFSCNTLLPSPAAYDRDGDLISDACDECPDLSGWANATDQDEDGYSGSLDNCPCEFNPDQDDCDGDGWGDACDPTPCIRFHGAGVGSAASKGSNAMLWTETPSLIPVHYRTIGEGTHDVQVRWCDCMNPLAVGDYSWSECTQYNCTQADPADDYEVHFLHERWHIASTNSTPQLSELEPVSVPDADHKLRVDCPWYSNDWSDVQPDEQTGLEAYHCTPRKTDYDCLFNEHTTYWDWQNELWWRDVQAGDGLPFKEAPGRGFVWIRAESDAVGYPNSLRATVNFYDTFELPIPHGVPNPILKFSWPTPLDDIPFEELVTPVDEIAGGLGEPVDGDLLGGSAIVLYSLSDAAGEVIGKYAYPGDGFGADAAIAGIMVVFADPHGLGPSAIGYSVAAGPAGAPTTTGFAAARVPGSLARFDGSYPTSSGIALFGGEFSDGSKDGRLWLGSYAGVDGEGTPYIAWTDVTPPAGNSPPPRSGAGMVFDGQTERLLLLGGEGAAGEALGDMWAFDLATSQWQQLTPLAGLPALSGFSLAACGGDAYLLGGLRGDGLMSTIVYRLGERAVEIVGDLEAGPGGRERLLRSKANGMRVAFPSQIS